MTAADRVQEAPRPGHGAPGRHSAYPVAPARRAAGRPAALVVAPSICSAVLAAAAIVIVVNGAQSAGYHLKGGTMAAVWVLGALIAAVVVAAFVFAGRQSPTIEIPSYPVEPERRQAPPPPMPQPAPQPVPPVPAPAPQQAPPQMPPQAVANATETAAILATAGFTSQTPSPVSDEGVDLQVIFAQLVRRLLTLVLQQINRLDELENEVEDPKLLKSLFGIDHQATQVRRYGENIGVLVGALPQRQWTHPVPVTVAQRSAVSETPDYPRVQVIPRAPGRIHGHAVSDVIHILSELVENATNYSNPTTKVTVGAHRVAAGLAIEVNDHGIGMEADQFRRLNTLLRDPSGANVRDLLSQGRIGLSVVAKMAQRHGIAVELAPNVTGGTMALVVIPDALLAPEELPADRGHQPRRGVDTTQLPVRPALAPVPEAVPAGAATPRSASLLSPVAASAPPLPSPATTHVPPLPTPAAVADEAPRAAHAAPVRTTVPPPLPSQPVAAQPIPAQPAQAVPVQPFPSQQYTAPAPSAPSAPSHQSYPQPDYAQAQAQPERPQPAHGRPAPPSAPADSQWPSITPPRATGSATPQAAAPTPRPTGADAPLPVRSAGNPYAVPGSGAAGTSWSRPGGQSSETHAEQPFAQPQAQSGGPASGVLPDGRPQLRRRTPQGHISARLLQADGGQEENAGGALSPTMMSDFWQGLSSGTAPADPPAAGPDSSQHDRTTANRQEWNQ